MRSLVVYESSFGNTQRIARTVADALAAEGEVTVISVDNELPHIDEFDLVVVGAPTHVHGLSSRMSRKAALEQQRRDGSIGIGVRGWIEELPAAPKTPVAVFDTRVRKSEVLVGSAGQRIGKKLRRRGFALVGRPESFFVEGTPGPLEDGELERAEAWGRRLVGEVTSPAA